MTTYAIVECPKDDDPLWDEVVQTHDSARHNVDDTHCVVKWSGETPKHLPDGAPLYYHPDHRPDDPSGYKGDILSALDTPEWAPKD